VPPPDIHGGTVIINESEPVTEKQIEVEPEKKDDNNDPPQSDEDDDRLDVKQTADELAKEQVRDQDYDPES